jgi:hypothetical protein
LIAKLEPDTVRKGETTPVLLRITGERMGKVSTVRIKGEERKPETVADQQVTLTLKKEDVASSGDVQVVVVDPEAGPSPSATLRVVDITGTPLPTATVGTDYAHPISASGGAAPYTFALVGPPAWLTIDPKTGQLSGKPTAPGSHDVVVKVTDKSGASLSLTLPLTVK